MIEAMSYSIEPSPPPDYNDNPNWGVIVLTGVVGLLLILGAGLLLRQAGDAVRAALATDTPSAPFPASTYTPQPPVLVLEVPAEGYWQVSLSLSPLQNRADSRPQVYEYTGRGPEIRIPQVEQPLNTRAELRALLEVELQYPQSSHPDAPTLTNRFSYPSLEDYQAALAGPFYALYAADASFLRFVTDPEALPPHLEVQPWAAPSTPAPSATAIRATAIRATADPTEEARP